MECPGLICQYVKNSRWSTSENGKNKITRKMLRVTLILQMDVSETKLFPVIEINDSIYDKSWRRKGYGEVEKITAARR